MDSTVVRREVANLRAIQTIRPGGFDSVPRVVAFEEYRGHPILVETALVGQPMDPAAVRRDLTGCCDAVFAWLTEVQQPAFGSNNANPNWFERLIERPLLQFAASFPLSAEDVRLLERTSELVRPLRNASLPLVFEHGDLSHPNIILLKNGGAGVVDWETAEPDGLPVYDLFFFLAYVAFAQRNVRSGDDYLSAFHAAFFGSGAWACPYVRAYAERLQLPPHVLTPLFVLCWVRYTANLLIRLGETGSPQGPLGSDAVAWLRANRYYALWRHTIEHVNEIDWCGLLRPNTGGT